MAGQDDSKPPESDEATLAMLGQFRFDGVRVGSEPIWQDRLRELVAGLPQDLTRDLAYRLTQAMGQELVDFTGFAERHGLTPSESLLVESLAEGLSVAEHAEQRGISVNTARVHMQRVLEKTGAGRQAELLRMLLGR